VQAESSQPESVKDEAEPQTKEGEAIQLDKAREPLQSESKRPLPTQPPKSATNTSAKIEGHTQGKSAKPDPRVTAQNLTAIDLSEREIQKFSHPYDGFSESSLKVVAQNPKAPPAVLAWLAAHRNPHIRAAVAKNPNSPLETRWVLARDQEASIRYSIAENLGTSTEILRELSRDRNSLIASTAQTSLQTIRQGLMNSLPTDKKSSHAAANATEFADKLWDEEEGGDEEFYLMIASKSSTPPRRLKELARSDIGRVRAAVAQNPNTPLDALCHMANDPDPNVKIRLAENPHLPSDVLEKLIKDKDFYVVSAGRKALDKLAAKLAKPSNEVRQVLTWP
jgi:hypothetical protein